MLNVQLLLVCINCTPRLHISVYCSQKRNHNANQSSQSMGNCYQSTFLSQIKILIFYLSKLVSTWSSKSFSLVSRNQSLNFHSALHYLLIHYSIFEYKWSVSSWLSCGCHARSLAMEQQHWSYCHIRREVIIIICINLGVMIWTCSYSKLWRGVVHRCQNMVFSENHYCVLVSSLRNLIVAWWFHCRLTFTED